MAGPKPNILIRFRGKIKPEDVPLSMLNDAMMAFQRLASEMSGLADDELQARQFMQLLNVRRGSAAYQFLMDSPGTVTDQLRLVGHALKEPLEHDFDEPTITPIMRLSRIARRLRCDITIEVPHGRRDHDVLATIRPNSYSELWSSIFVRGETSVSGNLQRVGGAQEMKCALRVPNRPRLLICKISSSNLARDLGRYLYENITVTGPARWIRTTWTLRTLTVQSFETPKNGSVLEALDRAWDAGADAWDDIDDPETFITEMTGA